jgi:membrane protein DedA with SNARE-associated domain
MILLRSEGSTRRARTCGGERRLTEALIEKLGYVGIALILVLGGLGLPVPEEAPIILAAVLSKGQRMWWPFALTSCFVGVLVGDFIVYFIGYFYGEKVLSLPLTRKFLTRSRETQIKGYFHRHGFKILILGRFAVGFRTAAYLTAGILQLPVLRLFLTDVFAASLSTLLMFGLGWIFANQIESSFDKLKHWVMAIAALVLACWMLHRYYKGRQRSGLLVGPPVLDSDDAPLPPDDLHAHPETTPPTECPPTPTPIPPPPEPPVVRTAEPVVAPPKTVEDGSTNLPAILDPTKPIVTAAHPAAEPEPPQPDQEVCLPVDPNRSRSLESRPR